MASERGLDRLLAFSDAVVAIALTLLVLPLVDVVAEADDAPSVGALVSEHSDVFLGFGISFAVIWVLWRAHHQTLEHFASYDEVITGLHFVWLLTIVLLPFSTELISVSDPMTAAMPVYVTTLLVSVVALRLIVRQGRRRPALLRDDAAAQAWRDGPEDIVLIPLLAVVLVITIVAPGLGAYPMLLLFLQAPVAWVRARLGPGPRTG
ncbi:putative membrane protein [Mumia flava]|uniref:Putative membrane protein n=1 Tax=Mumia flava TaxID=1348852 RepID=A0A0B2BUK1_9ACTN|nr:TMEM175 family protein [Mumia flava]PJJ58188.1 putative membrane protein [Mumia flava]